MEIQKDVLSKVLPLFLGSTGNGLSMKTLFVTGAVLTADFDYTDEFHIITLDPDLMIHPKSGVAYCDCPHFIDTRKIRT